MRHLLIAIFLFLSIPTLFGQDEIWMRPNKGQWHDNVQYKIDVPGGFMYLENNGFTYQMTNLSNYHHGHEGEEIEPYEHQVVKTKFIGANESPAFAESKPSSFYENYFIGNDPSNWTTHLTLYNQVKYLNLYDGIDLQMYQKEYSLKYDVIVQAGTDPSTFKVKYEGQDKLKIKQKTLEIQTKFATIIEGEPVAFQYIDGSKTEVKCEYVLEGNTMHFEFPDGYDEDYELIIDPDLTFSTFTGSTADNWGMTACPDIDKKLVAAGVVFGSGYPVISGYSATFSGGHTDIGLTKFTPDGSGIEYSTYIGGSNSETPHSIITNSANELYMMGATSSSNFPVGSSAYQSSYGGGSSMSVDGISFSAGSDIFVLRVNAGGDAVNGTYLGGASDDGIASGSDVAFNYGDRLRGEVMVDDASNVYIASVTQSSDFPIVGGPDGTLGGPQDAVVAKLNPGLTTLMWSTFLGGVGRESGNSVKLDGAGNIYVAGGTTSSDMPNTTGKLNSSFQGGSTDGYVYKFNAPGYGTFGGTYLGTSDYDQSYFVELDPDEYVYVYGQTKGPYPVSGGLYENPNSGQFIHKITNDLTASEWSTVFGSSSGNEELSPTAFLVSDCYEIYIAGWGGDTNVSNSEADNSSSDGMPITSDAYQSTTNGSNFYLALFEADMNDLKYSTYMGSLTTNGDHVDGGTSRFDKGGGVYHAVCAACGGNPDGFPSTSGVWSETNNSSNCNMAAFLFELSKIDASISIGSPVVCIPDPVEFMNDSENGDTYFWDFGDGETSTDYAPTHYYDTPGDYEVMLVVSHSSGCYTPDTTYIDVTIELKDAEAGTMIDTICPGSSVELWAIGGSSYSWGPADVLDDPTSSNPVATIDEETTFTVTVESECGTSEVEVTVYVFDVNTSAGGDTAICAGGSANIYATGGDDYLWSPATSCDDPTSPTPEVSPPVTTYYEVLITTEEGCEIYDTVKVHVDQDLPYPNLVNKVTLCKGESTQIFALGATSYEWSPDYNISETDIYNPMVWPEFDTTYHVTFTNACGSTYDSVFVEVIDMVATRSPDTIVCPGQDAPIWASGGVDYSWSPNYAISSTTDSLVMIRPWTPTMYTCVVTDEYGCSDMVSVNVTLHDLPDIKVSPDRYAVAGDSVDIWAEGPGVITWAPPFNISCVHCPSPFVFPDQEQIYTATVTDENGCKASAPVTVYYDPLIYVPNVFTPDGNGINPVFHAVASNISEFEMLIFNRWGEVVWKTETLDNSWDGSYNGTLVKDDVYVWQIKYTDINGKHNELRGHVTVLK